MSTPTDGELDDLYAHFYDYLLLDPLLTYSRFLPIKNSYNLKSSAQRNNSIFLEKRRIL